MLPGREEDKKVNDMLEELLERYATQYDLSVKEARKRYLEGRVSKRELPTASFRSSALSTE